MIALLLALLAPAHAGPISYGEFVNRYCMGERTLDGDYGRLDGAGQCVGANVVMPGICIVWEPTRVYDRLTESQDVWAYGAIACTAEDAYNMPVIGESSKTTTTTPTKEDEDSTTDFSDLLLRDGTLSTR
ncbi:MAG: hypothetical protein EP330_22870 [Deltaproteobacteria bacterium]|nr:MAG: hypothetical protein EP330_22870 [Deltaproteobacteria bacterium]